MNPPLRRARPLLGTLVEIGVMPGDLAEPAVLSAVESAFEAVSQVQRHMSRFLEDSDVACFNALQADQSLLVHPTTAEVLRAAQELALASEGLFNITEGQIDCWALDGLRLFKLKPGARMDLSGIAKGYAVDRAVASLEAAGCAGAWVNAGGDLRAHGEATVPVWLRDEAMGGARPFAHLSDGAMATSHFAPDSRSQTWLPVQAHVTVVAPQCMWADALTKVVAMTGDMGHPLLADYHAHAWRH